MFFSGATDEEGRLEESGAALTSATMSSGTITPGLLIKIRPARMALSIALSLLGPCFVAPKVLREEAASAEIVPRKWPKVPFYRASALQTDIKIE